MSEFIMGNESQKKNHSRQHSSSGHWRAVRTRGSPPAPLLELGELASAGDGSQQLSPDRGERACESLEHQPTSPGAPALLGRGAARLQAELPSSPVPGANPGREGPPAGLSALRLGQEQDPPRTPGEAGWGCLDIAWPAPAPSSPPGP